MDLASRPSLSEFEPLVGESFEVVSMEDPKDSGAWTLDEVERHEAPSIEVLEGADCFTLVFETPSSFPQACYKFRLPTGKERLMVATPIVSTNGKLYSQVVIF